MRVSLCVHFHVCVFSVCVYCFCMFLCMYVRMILCAALSLISNPYKKKLLMITWKDEVRNENIWKNCGNYSTSLKKTEMAAWDMYWKWRTPECLVRQYSENWEATRESRDGQRNRPTGWTSSVEIWRTWTLPGKKPKNWPQTKQNGVKVWPNIFTSTLYADFMDAGWTKTLS